MSDYKEVDARGLMLFTGLFTPECFTVFENARAILQAYNVTTLDERLEGIYHDGSSQDKDLMMVAVQRTIEGMISDLICQHGIDLSDEASLKDCNAILSALFMVQSIEDPIPYLRLIEVNNLDAIEKFCEVIGPLANIDPATMMTLIEDVEDSLITRLRVCLETQETKLEAVSDQDTLMPEYVDQLKAFFEHFGKDLIGYQIIESGMRLFLPVETYITLFDEHLKDDHPETLALMIYSVLILGSDSWNNPLQAYRDKSDLLVAPAQMRRVETKLMSLLSNFSQYLKAKHDAIPVSAV